MKGRRIVVDGEVWTWRVGRGGGVVARSEDGEVRKAKAWDLKGLTPDNFERGKWKETSDGMLRPREVAKWLKKG
jgi:hypothetical protein